MAASRRKNTWEERQLFYACWTGDLDTVKASQVALRDVRDHSFFEYSPLNLAAMYGHIDIVKYLVNDAHCDPDVQDSDGRTPLHRACVNGHIDIVKYLVNDAHCDPHVKDSNGETPLHKACWNGHIDIVKYLVNDAHCDPHVKDSNGKTPLHKACWNGHIDIVKYLVNDAHCDPHVQDSWGMTPLHWACRNGHIDIVKYLVNDAHCDPHVQDRVGQTPLHWACSWGWTQVVECLLTECHCDPNCTTSYGSTPLAMARNTDTIRLLLQHGAVATDVYKCSTILPYGSPRKVAKSTIAVFMVGDKGAGKSTLTKALMTEREGISRFTGRWSKVGDVKEKTAGMECHTIHSSRLGSLAIYDIAGHREFHSSHDTVIRSAMSGSSSGIFLFVIDLTASEKELQKTVFFWLSFIQNQLTSVSSSNAYLLVVGSHGDIVKSKFELRKKETVIVDVCNSVSKLHFVGFIAVDCQHSESSALTQIRSHVREIQTKLHKTLAVTFDMHCLHVYLVSVCGYQPGIKLDAVMQSVEDRKGKQTPEEKKNYSYLQVLPNDLPAMSDACIELNKRGIVLYLQKTPLENSWVIIERDLLLKKVNGTVFAPEGFQEHMSLAIHTGIVPYGKIHDCFKEKDETKHIDTEIIIQFLCHMEFCCEIKDSNMLELLAINYPRYKEQRHFLFPGLITEKIDNLTHIESPRDLWGPNPLISYSEYSSCWVLQCHSHQHYLSPRFHQVLLLRLAFTHALPVEPHEADPTCPTLQQACTLWKNGIKWTTTSSVEALVEISDSQVVVVMRCEQGKEKALVRIRTEVVKEVMLAKHEFCSNTVTVEMFIPNPTYPVNCDCTVSITKIAYSISKHEDAALANDHARTPVNLHKLLHYEPFALLPQECLSLLYSPDSQAHTVTPQFIECAASTFSYVSYVDDFCTVLNVPLHKVVVDGAYHKAERMFQVWQTQTEGTYQCLRQHMDKYSVFSGRNILEIANVSLASLPAASVVTSEETLCKLDSQPSLQELQALPHNGDHSCQVEGSWHRTRPEPTSHRQHSERCSSSQPDRESMSGHAGILEGGARGHVVGSN